MSLFEVDNEKRRKLGFVMDGIRSKYGSKAILRAVSYTSAGTALHRSVTEQCLIINRTNTYTTLLR
ncbi:hypothetical protein KM195_09970 [Bacillus sp. SPARC3]|nr:hypothetical protein [Bacillus sp. SPARC3]